MQNGTDKALVTKWIFLLLLNTCKNTDHGCNGPGWEAGPPGEEGIPELLTRLCWTFSRLFPIWKPFICSIADSADMTESYDTKPEKKPVRLKKCNVLCLIFDL